MSKPKKSEYIAIRIRAQIPRELYDLAKKQGYKLSDLRSIIHEGGFGELNDLLACNEEDRRICANE